MKNLDQYILESLKGYKPSTIDTKKPKEQLPENCSKYFANQTLDVDNIENLDTSNVTNMYNMFGYAKFNSDSLDLSSWDVSNVEDMSYMFQCCSIKYLDLSNWDTSSLEYINNIFYECKNLEYLDMSGWDTSKVKNASKENFENMFLSCNNLTYIRFGPGWGKSKDMQKINMFYCGKDKEYKMSDETWESMLTMYDRKKAGLIPMNIYLRWTHNIPDGWEEKMKERGYEIIVLGRLNK